MRSWLIHAVGKSGEVWAAKGHIRGHAWLCHWNGSVKRKQEMKLEVKGENEMLVAWLKESYLH